MADEFCPKMPDFHVTFRDLLHAVNLRHGTDRFTSLPKEGVLRIFFALKNSPASVGFEPANLGTKGQHATSRPPKPLNYALVSRDLSDKSFMFHLSFNLKWRSEICTNMCPTAFDIYHELLDGGRSIK